MRAREGNAMHVRVTNRSPHDGTLLVDDGDHDDDDRPPRLKVIPAGESIELALTVRGTFTAVGFDAHAEAVPRRIRERAKYASRMKRPVFNEPEKPVKTKARKV
jgi:hypothetical protein